MNNFGNSTVRLSALLFLLLLSAPAFSQSQPQPTSAESFSILNQSGQKVTLRLPSSGVTPYSLFLPPTAPTVGDLFFISNGSGQASWLNPGAAGQVLQINGGVPTWQTVNLLPSGSTTNSTLVWNGTSWVENTNVTMNPANGNTSIGGDLNVDGVSTFNDSAIFDGSTYFSELPDIIEWADGDSIGASGRIFARQAMDPTLDGTADTVVITDGGRVGIGTRNPSQQLQITQNMSFPSTTTNGTQGVIYKDGSPFIHSYNGGTFVGTNAGNLAQTTGPNTGGNIGFGGGALTNLGAAEHNVALGSAALALTTTGSRNIGIGSHALSQNTTGVQNLGIGTLAGSGNTTGSNNIAIGEQSMRVNATGSGNIALGFQSLYGFGSVGSQSHSSNIAIGYRSGFQMTTGSSNLLIGESNGDSITTGSNNIVLGVLSGRRLITGSNNLLIGYNINAPSGSASNQMSIGNLIFGTGVNGSGTTISSGNIGIGINAPTNRLHVEASSDPVRFGGLQVDNSLSDILVVSGTGVVRQRPLSSIINPITTNATLIGDGTSGNPLGINLANPNTWTGAQTFNSAVTMNTGAGPDLFLSEDGFTRTNGSTSTFSFVNPNVNAEINVSIDGILTLGQDNFPPQVGRIAFNDATSGDGRLGSLRGASPLTANRIWQLPDADGTIALVGDIATDATLAGDGTTGDPLRIDLANGNTWTASQAFSAGVSMSGATSPLTLNGSTGTTNQIMVSNGAGATPSWVDASTVTLSSVTTNATLTGDGTSGNPLGINLANGNTWTASQAFSVGASLSGATSPLTLNGSTGTANQVMISNGAGATPSWVDASSLSSVTTNATLTGDGSVGNPLGINLANANTWTGAQTFNSAITLNTAGGPNLVLSEDGVTRTNGTSTTFSFLNPNFNAEVNVSIDGSLTLGQDNFPPRVGQLYFNDDVSGDGFLGVIRGATPLSANRTYTLPDATGTIALVGDITANAWSLTGNASTSPGTNFLGTTDLQPVAFRTNSVERMRLGTNYQLQGGSSTTATGANAFAWGSNSAATGVNSAISGGDDNAVTADYGAIGGGKGNRVRDNYGVIAGGNGNTAGTSSGGTTDAQYAVVGGGDQNTASGLSATVAGGNTNIASGVDASIGGGEANTASGDGSVVSGGRSNTAAGLFSAIPGGVGMTLTSAAYGSFGFMSNGADISDIRTMTIATPYVAAFGNTDLWLANNDNSASQLRFYEPNSTAGAFPGSTNYTAFRAGTQSADITYTLPTTLLASAAAASGLILQQDGTGVMSWVAPSSIVTGGRVSTATAVNLGGGWRMTINDASVTASNVIVVVYEDPAGGASRTLFIGARTAGTSFDVHFSGAPAAGTFVNYHILP